MNLRFASRNKSARLEAAHLLDTEEGYIPDIEMSSSTEEASDDVVIQITPSRAAVWNNFKGGVEGMFGVEEGRADHALKFYKVVHHAFSLFERTQEMSDTEFSDDVETAEFTQTYSRKIEPYLDTLLFLSEQFNALNVNKETKFRSLSAFYSKALEETSQKKPNSKMVYLNTHGVDPRLREFGMSAQKRIDSKQRCKVIIAVIILVALVAALFYSTRTTQRG